MKLVTDLMPTFGKSSDTELIQDQKQKQKERAAEVVNKLFEQLKATCPAMVYTLDKSDDAIVKRQWVISFIENGVNSAMINAGMMIARRKNNPHMPSVGQFIEWCGMGLAEQYGLLSPADLVKKMEEYCYCRGLDNLCGFDYGNDVNYWLVNDLYRAMQDENLSKSKLLDKAQIIISNMAKKLMKGYVVPSPIRSLPETIEGKILTREESLSRLQEIKKKYSICHATAS